MTELPPGSEVILSPFESLVGNISIVFWQAMDWVGKIAGVVTSHPLLLVGVIVGFVGIGVGLFKRLVHV